MQRIPEPELMDDESQARAYAEADFSEPHDRFVALFRDMFPGRDLSGTLLDLGCGPADVTVRFARAFHGCTIDGVDAASAMLRLGREAVEKAGLAGRIRLIEAYLPGAELPLTSYDGVISNSLLHHLNDPLVLWEAVKRWCRPGGPVFVMDLMRPESTERAEQLVGEHAAEEPEVLRRDFYNSLCAAYTPDEICTQLAAVGLPGLEIRVVSDRHLIVAGTLHD